MGGEREEEREREEGRGRRVEGEGGVEREEGGEREREREEGEGGEKREEGRASHSKCFPHVYIATHTCFLASASTVSFCIFSTSWVVSAEVLTSSGWRAWSSCCITDTCVPGQTDHPRPNMPAPLKGGGRGGRT